LKMTTILVNSSKISRKSGKPQHFVHIPEHLSTFGDKCGENLAFGTYSLL
jgi:hypothetical protein